MRAAGRGLGYEEGYRAAAVARQREAAEATGRAIDAAGGVGPYLCQEHEHRLGLIPATVAERIAAESTVGHGSGHDCARPTWAD